MSPKKKRINQRTNLTLPPKLKDWANDYAEPAGYKNLSGLVTSLLREMKEKAESSQQNAQDVLAEEEAARSQKAASKRVRA
jgi:Arc/MetJ-type ribon-helix-helix transcriptional regulator